MVGLQVATAVGMAMSILRPSCATSDQCSAGMWCETEVGLTDRCAFCGEAAWIVEDIGNLTRVAEACTLPYEHDWLTSTTVASWCETCVRNDGTVNPLTQISLETGNLAAMGVFDDVAITLAAFTVAVTVVGELKDIELCFTAVVHMGDKVSKGWQLAMGFLLLMRRWVFLPFLSLIHI